MNAASQSIAYGPAAAPAPTAGRGPLEWFESSLAARPEALAVVAGPTAWTYRDLDATAGRIARALRPHVTPGELVGVCLPRSPAIVATAVALARLGVVYLPMGAAPGADRLRVLTEDVQLRCLLAGETIAPPDGWQRRPFDGPDGLHLLLRADRRARPHPGGYHALTTSGSTGIPKTALVPERAVANLVAWTCDRLRLAADARVSLLVESTFDAHLWEIWSALSVGAALCVAPPDVRSSISELTEWWREDAVTHCLLPTPLAELLLGRAWPAGLAMRHLVVGGDRMRARPPADCTAAVHNLYGPAECTVIATSHRVEPASGATAGTPVPIGTPINGVTLFVTDPDGRPVPRGQAGELRIGGAGLALGYVDPARTAESFVTAPGPVHAADDRVYRTGDRVVMRPDGVFEFVGRLDDQVKISGVRIEPAEVERAIEAHGSVRQAVVLSVPGANGAPRLVAFVRLADGATPDAPALLHTARSRLLEQAVPAVVRFVDAFPLNANGKIDRARLTGQLPAPAAPDETAADGADAEGHLLAFCRRLLDQPDLTADQNFADAGVTSLAAAHLLTEIEQTYHIHVRAVEIMRQPDLRTLAALVEARRS